MRHGSAIDPPNRFERLRREIDWEQLEWEDEYRHRLANRQIEYLDDDSQSIVSENQSPDIPFRFSVNPYRGCAHGCAYCYARPTHEYLGLNAGLDFETKIVVKRGAATLLRQFLQRKSWRCEPITFSGVTDCYQPAERVFQLTRQCLQVAAEFRQPVNVITKNALVVRDLDLLQPLAQRRLVHVLISITTLDRRLASDLEPRTSTPEARLRAIAALAAAGIPVGVMVAPLIPGLNETEMAVILEQAKAAGAAAAGYTLLRLPLTVEPVFLEWLQRVVPLKADKVRALIGNTRDGQMNQSQWGRRMTGSGPMAAQIQQMFHLFRRKHGLHQPLLPHDCSQFQRPAHPESGNAAAQQLRLF